MYDQSVRHRKQYKPGISIDVGNEDGAEVGSGVGLDDGAKLGDKDGDKVGSVVGVFVVKDGAEVGLGDTVSKASHNGRY